MLYFRHAIIFDISLKVFIIISLINPDPFLLPTLDFHLKKFISLFSHDHFHLINLNQTNLNDYIMDYLHPIKIIMDFTNKDFSILNKSFIRFFFLHFIKIL